MKGKEVLFVHSLERWSGQNPFIQRIYYWYWKDMEFILRIIYLWFLSKLRIEFLDKPTSALAPISKHSSSKKRRWLHTVWLAYAGFDWKSEIKKLREIIHRGSTLRLLECLLDLVVPCRLRVSKRLELISKFQSSRDFPPLSGFSAPFSACSVNVLLEDIVSWNWGLVSFRCLRYSSKNFFTYSISNESRYPLVLV
jgi:hypothetical protein